MHADALRASTVNKLLLLIRFCSSDAVMGHVAGSVTARQLGMAGERPDQPVALDTAQALPCDKGLLQSLLDALTGSSQPARGVIRQSKGSSMSLSICCQMHAADAACFTS